MNLYKVEDGGTHWVSAESMADAIEVVAEPFGGLTEYMDECDHEAPKVELYLEPQLYIMTQDAPDLLKDFPSGCDIVIRVPRSAYKNLPRGCVSTTEY